MPKTAVVIDEEKLAPPHIAAAPADAHERSQLAELWRFRELLYFLAWRDVKVRYKQAAFGAAWAIIQPLATMIIFSFFFSRVAKVPSGGLPYSLFCYSALVPWVYFASTLSQAGNSLVGNSSLITKIYFPRVLLPAASAFGGLLDFCVGSSFLAVLMLYYRIAPTWHLIFWPLAVLGMVIVSLGISLLLAAMNVRYRDVKHVIPFMIQLGLFITPVLYPANADFLPPKLRLILAFNPLSGVMEAFRATLFPHQNPDFRLMGLSLGIALLVLLIGSIYFRRAERTFADII
ncbi:MAG TPA: ABC transporter permease [Candidatus Acidoferrales bacterium]|nr:ABC transporter permease [Candidatus Acidoferrales bacterium]